MMPMTMFASMMVKPSHTYGRHHSSRPNSRMIQAPQAAVEKASTSPIAGEPRSSSSDGFVPAQYSMAKRMAMNTMALPRSGCSTTRETGTPTITHGYTRSRSVVGGSRRSASQRDSIRMTASLASSAGCPRRTPAVVIQDFSPAAVPAPVPVASVNTRTRTVIAYAYGVAHSSSRGERPNMRNMAAAPMASQIVCRCQIVATKVGTSVCPAEYSVARPYAASTSTTPASGLSISRRRGRIGGVRTRGVDAARGERQGVLGDDARKDRHRARRGVGREDDAHVGGERRVHPEVVPDHPRDERCDVRPLAGELDDRAHDDFGLVGGREADEPAVGGAVGVLRRAGFPRDRDGPAEPAGAARRAALDHADHRLAEPGELIGAQAERHVRVGSGVHQEGWPGVAVAREHLVEADHVDEGLRVLALSDREVQRDGRGPAARAVGAVVVLRPRWELGGDFSGQVDARARVESDAVRLLEQRAEADLEAELVEKDVAALGDGVGEGQVAVPLRRPAAEKAVAVLQPAAAGDRHVTVEGDEAPLQRDGRHGELPGRAGGIPGLDRAVEQGVALALVQPPPGRGLDTADERVGVEARCAVERQDLTRVRVEGEHRAALAGREDLGHVALQVQVDRGA